MSNRNINPTLESIIVFEETISHISQSMLPPPFLQSGWRKLLWVHLETLCVDFFLILNPVSKIASKPRNARVSRFCQFCRSLGSCCIVWKPQIYYACLIYVWSHRQLNIVTIQSNVSRPNTADWFRYFVMRVVDMLHLWQLT